MLYEKLSIKEKYTLLDDLQDICKKKELHDKKNYPKRKNQIEKFYWIVYAFLENLREDVIHEEHEKK